MPECKNCHSSHTIKSGNVRGKQRDKCKDFGLNFVEDDGRTNEKIIALKARCVVFYSLGKCSYNVLGKRFGRNRSLIDRWIREAGLLIEEPSINGAIKEIEFDEMWHLRELKTKHWLIQAVDRRRRKTVAWVLGGRDRTTFRRLYDKVKHLENCIFYTDHWNAFAEVLPAERHVVGKSGTFTIEQNNSNTRHHLERFTRRTKIVSKSKDRVDLTIRLWGVLTTPEVFSAWQAKFVSIYK